MSQTVLLGDIVDISSSKRIFYSEYVDKGVPFYRSKEIIEKAAGNSVSTPLNISEERFKEVSERFGAPESGDILLTSVGTLGIPYLVQDGERFYFKDGNLTWFRKYSNDLLPKYLYYWLSSPMGKAELETHTIGSTQRALTIQGLKKVKLPLLPIGEQQRIVTILDSINEKVELNRQMNETLEQIGQALFKYYFIDNPESKSWPIGKTGDLFDLTMGLSPKGESYNQHEDGLPLLNGAADFIGTKISPTRYTSAPTRISKSGDIIFCIRGTIGNVAIGYDEYCLGRGVAAMTPKTNATAYVYFSTIRAIESMDSAASGSVIRGLSKSDISDRRINIPPSEKLREYEEQAKPLIEHLRTNSAEIQSLITLRDSLLPRLISGKIKA